MEAVGGEVIVAISVPVLTLTALVVYYWKDVKSFLGFQLNDEVRM
jgi:hypothetical protein